MMTMQSYTSSRILPHLQRRKRPTNTSDPPRTRRKAEQSQCTTSPHQLEKWLSHKLTREGREAVPARFRQRPTTELPREYQLSARPTPAPDCLRDAARRMSVLCTYIRPLFCILAHTAKRPIDTAGDVGWSGISASTTARCLRNTTTRRQDSR